MDSLYIRTAENLYDLGHRWRSQILRRYAVSQPCFCDIICVFKMCVPLLVLALFLGVVSHGVQTRFNVSFKSIRPKWNRLNPLSGIKRLFSMKNAVELVKNSIKITLLLVLLYNIMKRDLQPMASMIDMNPAASAAYMMKMLFDLLIRVCIAFTVIAFGDYLYQRWEIRKRSFV